MKKLLPIVLALLLALSPATALAEEAGALSVDAPLPNPNLNTASASALLMEAHTGQILYEKNPTQRRSIASVTKIMTLLLVMEALEAGTLSLQDTVTVSEHAAGMGGSQAYMEPGETLSVHEMLKAVAVASANDGAVALAEHLAGSEEAFVAKMNARAQELGMENTHFVNATGLDDGQEPYSCALDVARMSRALLQHPTILDYTTIWTDSIRNGAFGLANTNKLIRFYAGANGLKTGFTQKAGFCLSASAQKEGMQLIAVVLGGPSSQERFADAKTLLNYGFATYALFDPGPIQAAPIPVWGGKESGVNPVCPSPKLLVEKGLKNKIACRVELAGELTAPVLENQILGKIVYESEGKVVKELPITAKNAVEKADTGFLFHRLMHQFFLAP